MMALKGMEKLLNHALKPRVVFMEIHPDFLPSFNVTTDDIFKFLSKFNYHVSKEKPRNKQILCKLTRKDSF
jgi:hypothetical protein